MKIFDGNKGRCLLTYSSTKASPGFRFGGNYSTKTFDKTLEYLYKLKFPQKSKKISKFFITLNLI